MDQIKKSKAILDHIDEIVLAIELACEEKDPSRRKAQLRSLLYYWLSIVYDDAIADRANLEVALSASQGIVKRLKEENKVLLKRLSDSR